MRVQLGGCAAFQMCPRDSVIDMHCYITHSKTSAVLHGMFSMLLNLAPIQVRDVTSTITIATVLSAFLASVDLPKHSVCRLLIFCFVFTSSQCMLNHVHLLRSSGGKF